MIRRLLLAAVLSVASTTASLALTLSPDPFTFKITASGEPDRSVAGTGGVDINGEDMGNGTTGFVTFVDGDTIDISFFGGFNGADAFDLVVELSGLNFLNNGVPIAIAGVTFNRAGSDIDQFIGDVASGQPALSDFVEPVLASTANSFEARFSFFHALLLGDGPRLRYDIKVSAVPLPAGLPLLAAGLTALAGLRLRKKRAAQK